MTIKMLRCGVCKFWYHLDVFRGKDGEARNVHCRYCGSYPVYFRHWFATHFNNDGKLVKRAQGAGLTGTVMPHADNDSGKRAHYFHNE